jgi:hypothetical protein
VLSITRFGRALVTSSLNPDEGIVLYRDLLKAQSGINLESNLHLIFLLTPVEHSLTPDFKKFMHWYEKSREYSKGFFIGDAIGINQGFSYLARWSHQPPESANISKCYEYLRLFSLQKWDEKLLNSDKISLKKLPDKEYFEYLFLCKRLWGSLAIEQIMIGKNLNKLALDFNCTVNDLDNLIASSVMVSLVLSSCFKLILYFIQFLLYVHVGCFKSSKVLC